MSVVLFVRHIQEQLCHQQVAAFPGGGGKEIMDLGPRQGKIGMVLVFLDSKKFVVEQWQLMNFLCILLSRNY